ncbi:hypothetical protein [Azohydromonas caseinilytica]|uniref:Uncharacterized protein n=1 Tax=Azohydromonas caseinilytica TaxID=2728836 RepID=A0A848FHB7_9BURK|nr:hypothetical protein [Azohydromonas caseinilytica]NML18868.1 hypothetical protein [Azohydromonas caseinilytica]
MPGLEAAVPGVPRVAAFHPRRVRWPSALGALGITGLFLWLLAPASRGPARPMPQPVRVIELALLPAAPVPAAPPLLPSRAAPARPPLPQARPPAAALQAVIPQAAPSVAPRVEVAAPAVEEPASAPLRLDGRVLRQAARDSAGVGQALRAERQDGRSTEPPPTALEQDIARAARPDCVGPNAQGSLLTLPRLALDALSGRCR